MAAKNLNDHSLQTGFDKAPKSKTDEIHEMVSEMFAHFKKRQKVEQEVEQPVSDKKNEPSN